METAFWFNKNWKDKNWKHSSLNMNWIVFSIDWQKYWVQQFLVFVDFPYIDGNWLMTLDYMTDEFGWHETMAKAKWAVETYIANVLHFID